MPQPQLVAELVETSRPIRIRAVRDASDKQYAAVLQEPEKHSVVTPPSGPQAVQLAPHQLAHLFRVARQSSRGELYDRHGDAWWESIKAT